MKKKKVLRSFIFMIKMAAVIAVALAFNSFTASASEEPIKIGCNYPMTGPSAADGEEFINGVTLAVEEINEKGGLLGRPLKIEVADTGNFTPEEVATAARILVQAGVDFIVTGYSAAPADYHAFGKYDVPYFQLDTNSSGLRAFQENRNQYWNIIQIDPSELEYGPSAFNALTQKISYKHTNNKVAVLTQDWDYSASISTSFKKAAIDAKWEVVVDERHSFGATEFGVQLTKIREHNPSIIFFSTFTPVEAASFIRGFLMKPTKSIIYIQYAPSVPEFIDLLGPSANGVVWQVCSSYLPNKASQDWVERYKKRFGRNPGFCNASGCFDGVNIWAEAVRNVGDVKKYREIINYVLKNTYSGLSGKYKIDPDTQSAKPGGDGIPMHFYQIQNGKHELLFLGDRAMEKVAFKDPPWLK
jgi:branched-chain amino acid transport system substrate-binding protein